MTQFSFSIGAAPSAEPMADARKLAALGDRVRERLLARPDVRDLGGDKLDLFVIPKFLSRQECRRLVQVIDRRIGPSTLFEGTEIDGFRTSSTHHFDRDDPATLALERKLADTLGIDHEHAEVMQGQRYQPGQQFKHHYDYFTVTENYWQQERRRGGQRSWTAMVFLNEPEAGGFTDFRELRLAIPPKTGAIAIWNNMDRCGRPNPNTLHAGLPVEAGSKYVITQWFRQEPFTLYLR